MTHADVKHVMILAAGRGNRLRPLTDKLPKPLVNVHGKSLIEHHLAKLSGHYIVINHAWLGHKIEKHLGNGANFGVNLRYCAEPEGGLETAGGIINALPFLTDGMRPFMVVNGDVYTDADIAHFSQQPLAEGCLAHLMLVPTPRFKAQGDFGLAFDSERDYQKVKQTGQYTFAGISLLHPDLFKNEKPGFLPLAPLLRQAIDDGKVTGELFEGSWDDIGTLERLEAARARPALKTQLKETT